MKHYFFPGLFLLLLLPMHTNGQDNQQLLQKMLEEEKEALNALALYPDTIRQAILVASTRPEMIVRMEEIQLQTKERFTAEIDKYSREVQEEIWELTRYPELIEQLAEGKKKNREEIQNVAEQYPEKIRSLVMKYGREEYDLIVTINDLNNNAGKKFEELISRYDQNKQQAFRQLIDLPEVISILSENIKMAVLLGDLYQRDQEYIENTLDSLSLIAAREHAEKVEDWKKQLEEDPEALNDFMEAANAYAEEQEETDVTDYSEYVPAPEAEVVSEYHYHYYHNVRPFNYWFGYPRWYSYNYWYPYPWWYDCGFYYGPGGSVVIFGLPSWHFTHWYLYRPHHHYRYPYLSNTFIDYYYGHRRDVTGLTTAVHQWVESRERGYLPRGWLQERQNRVEKLREIGAFETEYEQQANTRRMGRQEFLRKEAERFPNLRGALEKEDKLGEAIPPQTPGKRTPPIDSRPDYNRPPREKPERDLPDRRIPEREEPERVRPERAPEPEPGKRQPPPKREKLPPPKEPPVRKPGKRPDIRRERPNGSHRIQNAQEYHRGTWENKQP